MHRNQRPKPSEHCYAGRVGFRRSDFGFRISPPPPLLLLVIGYGNTLRSDDGVGPRVVEAVAALKLPQVQTLACDLLTPELADPIARAGSVVFVDAAVDAPREVQLRPLAPAESSQVMAHAADPRTMLALARDVFGHAPQAWWLTVPVENIGIGEQLSPFASRGLALAIENIKALASRVQAEAFGSRKDKRQNHHRTES